MDKTAQDSLAKKPVDMRDRILEHLEALTSAVSLDDLASLSTSDIAETLIISRSLASQYLNDLVRSPASSRRRESPITVTSRVPWALTLASAPLSSSARQRFSTLRSACPSS